MVKCLCLRRYFVTIQSRNSGVIFLQQVQILPNASFLEFDYTELIQTGFTRRLLGALQLYQSRETISGVVVLPHAMYLAILIARNFSAMSLLPTQLTEATSS